MPIKTALIKSVLIALFINGCAEKAWSIDKYDEDRDEFYQNAVMCCPLIQNVYSGYMPVEYARFIAGVNGFENLFCKIWLYATFPNEENDYGRVPTEEEIDMACKTFDIVRYFIK